MEEREGNTRFLPAVEIDVNTHRASFIPRFARDDKTARFEREWRMATPSAANNEMHLSSLVTPRETSGQGGQAHSPTGLNDQ